MEGSLPHLRRTAVLVIAVVIVALAVGSGVRARSGLQEVEQASNAVQGLELEIQTLRSGSLPDILSLQDRVARVETHLREARSQLTPYIQLSPMLGWMPRVGPRLRSAQDMLALGESLARASQGLLAALDLASSPSAQESVQLLQGNRFNEDILLTLEGGEPLFDSALTHLERARTTLQRLEERELPQDFQRMVTTAQRIVPDLEILAQTGLAATRSWRGFLGYSSPSTYMLVAHNSDELRATGGFIPGAWLLTFDRGEMTRLQFWDTTDVDDLDAGPPLPPEGLLQSLWAGAWLFRDAGWYPDFPSSARVMEQMFKLGQGASVDGVIALDQWAVLGILETLGPVTLPTGETLSAASYMEVLEEKTDSQGRGFMDTVLAALLDNLREQGSAQNLMPVLTALNRSLSQKHVLFYFHDPTLQEMARSNGWDGAVRDRPGDYLMVVDSNVGFSKVNRNVTQSIDYHVDLSADGVSEARLDILYTNHSSGVLPDSCRVQAVSSSGLTYQQQKNTCYWNYLRVYTPEGAALQGSSPFPMPEGALYRRIGYNDIEDTLRTYSESSKTAFAGFFNLEVGESRKVAFAYDLPPQTLQREGERLRYSLLLQKQPGTQSTPVEVTIGLPAGYCVWKATPNPSSQNAVEVQFDIDLHSDTKVNLILERSSPCKDRTAPPPASFDPLPSERTRTAFASVTIAPPTAGPAIERVQVSPQDAALYPGQRFLFTAVALDSQGEPVSDVLVEWRLKDGSAGIITSSGLFTAGITPGTYAEVVEVSATSTGGTASATASVKVITQSEDETRHLSSVIVYPPSITVRPGQVVGLGALGWDVRGRLVQDLDFEWATSMPMAGSVDTFGFFTASRASGKYPDAIQVTATQDTDQGEVKRRASISVTVTEVINRGVLSQVVVVPGAVTLTPGQVVSFITRAFDESGQPVPGASFNWEVTRPAAGTMEEPGQFVAGSLLGEFPNAITVVATQRTPRDTPMTPGSTLPTLPTTLPLPEVTVQVSTTVTVTIEPPRVAREIDRAQLAPGEVTLSPGQRFVFIAYGLDANGKLVPASADWEVMDPTAGSIGDAGVFTAGNKPGIFPNALRVRLSQEKDGQIKVAEAFATVKVLGPLERAEVRPQTLSLETGQSVRVRAVGYDANGLEIPSLRFRWSVEDPRAGSVDESGIFTAGAVPGQYENAIKVAVAEVNTQ